MDMLVIFLVLLLVGPLSLLLPERSYDDRDRRGWWPGTRDN
jgi:hypothetical protein